VNDVFVSPSLAFGPPRAWASRLRTLAEASRRARPGPPWFNPVQAYFGSIETQTDPARYYWDGMQRLGPKDLPHVYFQFSLAGFGYFEEYGRPPQRVGPGTAFFALVPSKHRYYLPAESPGWTFAWIGIYHPYLLSRITQLVAGPGLVVRTPPSCPLIARAMRLVRGAYEKNYRDQLEAESALFAFTFAFERMVREAKDADSKNLLEGVRRRVRESLTQPLLVDDIAKEQGMSRSAFSHFFKARTGTSPAHYATEVRVDEAARLLGTTQLSLLEIAARCGFKNANHFGKVFRRFRKQSPAAFRRLVR
jgi:AraC-like DNA-binding protein